MMTSPVFSCIEHCYKEKQKLFFPPKFPLRFTTHRSKFEYGPLAYVLDSNILSKKYCYFSIFKACFQQLFIHAKLIEVNVFSKEKITLIFWSGFRILF
jgi:hypothetical protein